MGINFGDLNNSPAPTPTAPVQVQTSTGLSLDLAKSAVLDLTKDNPGLVHVKLGAGWDVVDNGTADLDISAFVLDENGKVRSIADVNYFKNPSIPGIVHSPDNTTGAGEGDDETIEIDLTRVASHCRSIVFVVNIFDAMEKKQTFGMVNNAYVRLMDADQNDKEICRFRLKEDASSATAVIFASLKKQGNDWQFEAIGEGKVVRDLNEILALYS